VVDGIGCNFTRLNPSKGIIQKNGREWLGVLCLQRSILLETVFTKAMLSKFWWYFRRISWITSDDLVKKRNCEEAIHGP
jgi:hypothetical protein